MTVFQVLSLLEQCYER